MRLISILLVLCTLLSLAACTSTQKPPFDTGNPLSTDSDTAIPDTTVPETEPETTPAQETTE